MIYLNKKELTKQLTIHLKGLKLEKNKLKGVSLVFENNTLSVTSTNKLIYNMTTNSRFEGQGITESRKFTVNVDEVINALKLSDEVKFVYDILIIGEIGINNIPKVDVNEYNFPKLEESTTYPIDFKSFTKAINNISNCAPKKDVRAFLFNYVINEKEVICSDGHRIACSNIPQTSIEALPIPAALGFMFPLLDNEGYIETDKNYLILSTDKVSIQSLVDLDAGKMSSMYGQIKDKLSNTCATSTYTIDREEFASYVQHFNKSTERTKYNSFSPVRLDFKDNLLRIQNPNLPTVFTCKVSSDSEATFSINGDYLYSTLTKCKSKQITITLDNLYFNVIDEKSNINQTICLMRL